MKVLAGVLALALLGGCASSAAIEAAREAEDDRQCVELGFEPGTDAYGNCRLQLLEIRALEDQARAMDRATWNYPSPWAPYGWPYGW